MSRILIADDDASILDALSGLLEDRYEVVVASNGEQAIERLASEPIDLIVLDMLMPLLDGEGVLREVRARGSRIPIIVVSARSERLSNFRKLGADDCIQKPFDFDVLEEKIERLLHRGSGSGTSRAGSPGAAGGAGRGGFGPTPGSHT